MGGNIIGHKPENMNFSRNDVCKEDSILQNLDIWSITTKANGNFQNLENPIFVQFRGIFRLLDPK